MNIEIKLPKPYDKQQEILDDTSRFKVLCVGRRSGKTTLCIIETILSMLNSNRVAYVTPEYGLAEKLFIDIAELIPEQIIIQKNKSRLFLKLKTGGSLKFFSGEALPRVRGFEFDLLILDEAAYLQDLEHEWNNSLRPLLMKTRGRAIFVSTPNGKNYFYSLFQKGLNNEEGFKSWQFSSHFNPYIPKEELQELIETMPEANYRQEILAEPGENTNNPFGTQFILSATIEELSSKQPIILAADLARVHDFTVIVGLDEDGVMCYFDRFQLPWGLTLEKLKEVRQKFPTPQLVLDATGVGSVIFETASSEIYNVYGFVFTGESKPKVIHKLIKAIETGNIKVNEQTAKEMHTYTFKYSASGHLKYEAAPGYHDDCIAALAMANNFKMNHNMKDTLFIF